MLEEPCFKVSPQAIARGIEDLLDENERLNNIINEITNNKHDKTSDEEYLKMSKEALVKIINNKNSVISSLDNENKKLNNIINELEKHIEKEKDRIARETSNIYQDSLDNYKLVNEDIYNELDSVLYKLKELKEKE